MEECSLDLFFYFGQLDHLVFWRGMGLFLCFQWMKLDFRQSESVYFCNPRKSFYNCY